ncbi:hypothetical protein LSTR_LSTR010756 [Laodelphax striatellus]|uniref:Uncharacterized protein n=1 Tax=Laodelphax striatellus TaxID=195883 RepID=A0A482XS65_LAOST|nr:hypothetical protein LSTR_LSTR010756 [Laodelphax striatellus]
MPSQSRSGRSKNVAGRSRHRATPAKLVPSGSGIMDIKLAIQQLTMRSHTAGAAGGGGGSGGGGYSTSTYSSLSGSESSEPAVRRLMRHSSLETINTNVTSADEFVWVDSHNRYGGWLQHLRGPNHDVLGGCQRTAENMGACKVHSSPLTAAGALRAARRAQRSASPSRLHVAARQRSGKRLAAFILCRGVGPTLIKTPT